MAATEIKAKCGQLSRLTVPEQRRNQRFDAAVNSRGWYSRGIATNYETACEAPIDCRSMRLSVDPDGHAVVYLLAQGPDGMSVDRTTGRVTWIPDNLARAVESVTLVGFDSRGAVAVQHFIIEVTGGNNPPTGTLDDTSWLTPAAHIWTRSALPWVAIPEHTANFPQEPDSDAALMEAFRDRSVRDRK